MDKAWAMRLDTWLVVGSGAEPPTPPRTPEKFRKFEEKFLGKLQNSNYLGLFFKIIKNKMLNFRASGQKT